MSVSSTTPGCHCLLHNPRALEGEMPVEGPSVDRLCGLEGVQADIATMRTPDGHGRVELTQFNPLTSPSPEDRRFTK